MRIPGSFGSWLAVAVVLALVGLAALRVMEANRTEEAALNVEQIRETQGIPVAVQPAQYAPMEVWRSFSGTVSGVRDAIVRARSPDQVAEVYVVVGERVSRGQLLVELSGEATGARARQAESALRQAARTVERLEPLYEAGAISEQEWENALTQRDIAEDELAALREDLQLVSPLAGIVTEVPARPGMIPEVGDPLVRVADLSQLVVRLQLSAADARLLGPGQSARIPAADILGEVRRVALQADPVSRLVEVEVAFPEGVALIPGTFARVEILVASRDEAVQVPRAAVRDGGVWVIDDEGRARRRSVSVGVQTGDTAEIQSGVQPGERVVVQGGTLLAEGALARVVGGVGAPVVDGEE